MSTPPALRVELDDKQIRAEGISLDADPALPPTRAWPVKSDLASLVYPNAPRYYVQRWQSVKVSWISPNSAAPGLPEPPSEDGPHACGCPGPRGFPEAVYGHMESERLWPCRADWYNPDKPERAFVPDIWRGLGPCATAGFTTVLHQFPAYVKDARAGRSWFRIEDSARRDMESAEGLDMDVLPWLFPEDAKRKPPSVPRLVFEGAPSVELLHARWAVWAVYLLKRRAFVGHEMVAANATRAALAGNAVGLDRMKRAYYFGYNAVGAWFDNTPEQVGIIRHFISLGVPVFYRWELNYAAKQKLADLRPCQAPDEELALLSSPASPTPGGQASASSPVGNVASAAFASVMPSNPELHWSSARRVPRDAADEYGYTLAEDNEAIDWFDQHEAEVVASQATQSSPAPSSVPSRAASVTSTAPPSTTATSSSAQPKASPASGSTEGDSATSWVHTVAARAALVPIQRRLSLVVTNVDWYKVPYVLEYFEQKNEYMLDAEGKNLAGRAYPVAVAWRARFLTPLWLPDSFKARRSSLPQSQYEQVEMAFRYGCAFQTLIPDWVPPKTLLPSPVEGYGFREAYFRAHAHGLSDVLNLVEGNPVSSFVENWAAALALFCQRPHARAALGAGGLLARFARWGGLSIAHALTGPSEDVRNWGTSHPIEDHLAGEVVQSMDDWLEPHEIASLHGRVHGSGKRVVSLWPDPDQFKRNWFNERGTWTLAMEIWFVTRLEDLWTNRKKPSLKSRAQWREEIRECKREEDTAIAKHG